MTEASTRIEKYLFLDFQRTVCKNLANKKLRSDLNCERRNSKRFDSNQTDYVFAKNAKFGETRIASGKESQ